MNAKKKKIIFLAPYPHGAAPSQRFRFEQYISMLESNGFEIRFEPFLNSKTWILLYSNGKSYKKFFGVLKSFFGRTLTVFLLFRYDYIFIHREVSHIGPPVFEFIISKLLRKKYIYDFDDAIWLPNYSDNNARFHRLKAYWKIKKIIKWAHLVSAGNDFLKTP